MEYEEKLSDIITSLPEVSGGFLYSADRGVYSNQTNRTADNFDLNNVGGKLSKIVSMLAVHFHDTGAIRITFKEQILFGMMIEDHHWLFLFHAPSLTPGMVKMTVQISLNIHADEGAVEQTAPFAPPETTAIEPSENTLQLLLAPESELSKPLNAIRDQLAEQIGPVAKLVFADSIRLWGNSTSPSLATLPELLTLLDTEIDDDNDLAVFRTKVNDILGEV